MLHHFNGSSFHTQSQRTQRLHNETYSIFRCFILHHSCSTRRCMSLHRQPPIRSSSLSFDSFPIPSSNRLFLHQLTYSLNFYRFKFHQDRPNVVVFVMDDLPFLEQWAESAPNGNNLEGYTVSLDAQYAPRIDEFREEAVIFSMYFLILFMLK